MKLEAKETIIEVNNVYKNFRVYYDKGSMLKEQFVNPGRSRYEEREILKGVSFKVYRGETIALIGQNGCGKSTMLKMLTKILYPNRGTVTVNGKVSSLIELGAGFHPDMSGRENIYINASILGIKMEEVDKRIDEIIRFSELEGFIDNPIRTYSSGMYMRLAFSVAINVDADILLIDEILAVGDQAFQEKCIRKLDELRQSGITVVLVSHSMGQIKEIADRCIWIENGQIREDGETETVCNHYEEAMTRRREERDELEEEQRIQEIETSSEAVALEKNSVSNDDEIRQKDLNIKREQILQNRKQKQEAFSNKWHGGGIQGKPLVTVAIISLMILLSVCGNIFVIDWEQVPEGILSISEKPFLVKLFGYAFFVLGRVSVPLLLILLGFELLQGDYNSRRNRLYYYIKVFLPVFITWEVWVMIYQFFFFVWSHREFDLLIWAKEALIINYVELGCLWIFRFVMLFMFITPYVALVLQNLNVGLLRFLMIVTWVLIFLFSGLEYYGQANGGGSSFPHSFGTFRYFFYFCLGFLISRYMQRIFKGRKEVLLFILSFALTVWSQMFFDARGVDYLIKPTFFGISLMALFGFDLLIRFKLYDMLPKLGRFFSEIEKCVIGAFFVYGPIQLVLMKYCFNIEKAHSESNVWLLILLCLGLWISVFAISIALVYIFNSLKRRIEAGKQKKEEQMMLRR